MPVSSLGLLTSICGKIFAAVMWMPSLRNTVPCFLPFSRIVGRASMLAIWSVTSYSDGSTC